MALITAMFLAACSTAGIVERTDIWQEHDKRQPVLEALNSIKEMPSIVRISIPKDAFLIKEPSSVGLDKQVSVEFNSASMEEIIVSLSRALKLNVIYAGVGKKDLNPLQPQGNLQQPSQATATQSIQNNLISITFNGPLKDLLSTLSSATGHFFVYEKGAITVKDQVIFNTIIPNYTDVHKEIEDNLQRLGANEIGYDNISSSLSFKCRYDEYLTVKDYLSKVRENLSLVTMRIVLLSVSASDGKSVGIDWSKVAYGLGSQKGSNTNTTSTTQTSDSTTAVTTANTTTNKNGISLQFSSSGANLYVDTPNFNVSSFLGMVEQYGKYNILQNVFLEALAGKKGKIEVLTETPYVSQVGVAAVSSSTTTTQATSQTEKAKSGVTMEIQPYYSKQAGTLGIKLLVGVYGITKYMELSAGTLGTLSQPETTKKTLDTYIRMTPSQVAIIGGLIYEKNTYDAQGLPNEDSILSKKHGISKIKEELVIVVKPSVIEFIPEK